jgi:hypothetical protein
MPVRPSIQTLSPSGFLMRLLGSVLDLLGRLLPGPGAVPTLVPAPVPRRPRADPRQR